MLPLLELEQSNLAQTGGTTIPVEPKIDSEFLAILNAQIQMANIMAKHLVSTGDQMNEDYYAGNALPQDAAMNKILRYEKAAQKKYDWALQQLLASQQRRRNSQTPS